jgi:hypothetical protein
MDDYKKSIKYNAKAKIQRMISPKQEKVDSSDWKAPEPLNADVKTGMRPISRRAYKRGGKVEAKAEGKAAVKRADRKAGGKVDRNRPMSVDDFLNRDQKMANEVREGGDKHVGGYKKGGRAKKNIGGGMPYGGASSMGIPQGSGMSKLRQVATGGFKKGGKVSKAEWEHSKEDLKQDKKLAKKYGMSLEAWEKSKKDEKHDKQQSPKGLKHGGKSDHASIKKKVGYGSSAMTAEADAGMTTAKKGGRIKKQAGGSLDREGMARMAAEAAAQQAMMVPNLERQREISRRASIMQGMGSPSGMRSGMTGTAGQVNRAAKGDREYTMSPSEIAEAEKIARENAGKQYIPPPEYYEQYDQLYRKSGGRAARKEGGRVKKAKGKTNINITINAGPKPMPGAMGLGEALAGGLPAGAPVPKMPPMAPAMPPMAPPMASGPAPMGGAPMPPMGAGGPPMPLPRKAGGRVHMTAGAGSGEGRLQKIEQYGEKPPRNARKTGGRANMTAGAGSGEGRLQKIDWYGKKA